MKTSHSLASLYDIINRLMGPKEAKRSVTTALSLVICEIQDEGSEVTPELIEKKLEIYVNDFIEVAKNTNVA
jgi:hypothetical protein